MRRRLRAFRAEASGAVALLVALLMPLLMMAGALSLDTGLLFLQRRLLQGATDAAALAAAERPDDGAAAVRRVLDANGQSAASFTLVFGRYESAAAGEVAPRFVPEAGGSTARVEARLASEVHFARALGIAPPAITTQAEATVAPVTSLSAGSRLASVEPVLLQSLLKPVLGVDLGLTALDYASLGKAHIDLDGLLKATAAVDASGAAATVEELAGHPVRIGPLLQAMADGLAGSGQPVAAAILSKAAKALKASPATARLADLVRLDADTAAASPTAGGVGLGVKLPVLGLLNGLLGAAAGAGPPPLTLSLPGIAAVDLEMQVGEAFRSPRPIAVSDAMPSVETAQVRLRLRLRTTGLLDLLNLRLEIPVELVVAGGAAEVVSLRCSPDPAAREVKVAVRPGLAKLALGAWSGPLSSATLASRPASAELVSAGLASVKAKGVATIGSAAETVLIFRGAEIGNGTTKTARSTGLGAGLVSSLMTNTELDVRLVGLGLPLSSLGLRDAVAGLLASLVSPLDGLLDAVLASVGVGLGEMDVRVDDLVCDLPHIAG